MRILIAVTLLCLGCGNTQKVRVGSKAFTESYLLAEIASQSFERATQDQIGRRFGMGGTGILVEALKSGKIDVYPEYTGTISEMILKNSKARNWNEIQEGLKPLGLIMTRPLGFNNSYALAVSVEFANKHRLQKISDLRSLSVPPRVGFSHEFVQRSDGSVALARHYGIEFPNDVQSMEHSLAYEAIANGKVDIIDIYTTDAKLDKLPLIVLEDDLNFFPDYQAVFLARIEFTDNHPELWQRLLILENTINEATMRQLNASIELEHQSFSRAVEGFLGGSSNVSVESIETQILRHTREHVFLVGIAMAFALLVGLPLGIFATRSQWMGQLILLLSGVIQTIPSLALLCLFVPFLGVGLLPALVALCLYSLLPVVLGTFTGVRSIDPVLTDMIQALGIPRRQSLIRLQLPLAARSILAGIRTSTVLTIGTATLAAMIGAGGYGALIVSGLATNNVTTILMGALPAAGMALIAHGIFNFLDRVFIPKALRK